MLSITLNDVGFDIVVVIGKTRLIFIDHAFIVVDYIVRIETVITVIGILTSDGSVELIEVVIDNNPPDTFWLTTDDDD